MPLAVPIENGLQCSILISSAIALALVTATVGLRLLAKHQFKGWDAGDLCALGAFVANTALHVLLILLVKYGAFGFHVQEIYARFSPDNATFFFKGIMAFAMIWNVTVCFSKLSVLFMYATLFVQESLLRWGRYIGIFVITWNVADIIAALVICKPIARNWDLTVPGTCGSQPKFYTSMGVINIVTDVAILGLPLPYLFSLQMPLRRKIMATGMLTIGVGTWVITIYRQTTLRNLDFADMTHAGVLATVLSGLEPSVAIALACLPQMRTLFVRKKPASYGYSSYSSRDNMAVPRDGEWTIQLRSLDGDSKELHGIRVKTTWDVVSDKPEGRDEEAEK
ncbi:hypothetical protein BU23DRAFT_598852 [Bimuria novae-zelandiae CBS 107.79]|uniref:Rhodopsin domain-containing protein n=1 Tax=Bimuria novae-zelandiae CBS 107.79 TaxID=1447943 RepID=A0A6A5VBM5_9PLEO|nr:hypothetical protein BU23DRAFT_598852 [Bimuria novae-zelandiae CBS 107.79]